MEIIRFMEKNMAFEQWDKHMVCDGKIQNLFFLTNAIICYIILIIA
jgi:hypothetical protein